MCKDDVIKMVLSGLIKDAKVDTATSCKIMLLKLFYDKYLPEILNNSSIKTAILFFWNKLGLKEEIFNINLMSFCNYLAIKEISGLNYLEMETAFYEFEKQMIKHIV